MASTSYDRYPFLQSKIGSWVGYRIPSAGICKKLELQLSEFYVLADYNVFPLRGVDVILGLDIGDNGRCPSKLAESINEISSG